MNRRIEILLVEDSPADVLLIQEALKESSVPFHLNVKGDGQAAIDYLQESDSSPDLILLDLNLPIKTGEQVLAEIRSNPRTKFLPVIVLTGSQSPSDLLKMYELHANSYLCKPSNLSDMFSMVKAIDIFWLNWAVLRGEIHKSRLRENDARQLNAELEQRIQQNTQELLENNRRLEELNIMLSQVQALIRTHPRGTITFWNQGNERMYGWTADEAVGRLSHDLLGTVFPDSLDNINAELERTGQWSGELVHCRRDGTQVWVASHWALRRSSDGQAFVVEVNNDISAEKRAEEARSHLASIVESSQDAIIGKDLKGIVTSWNKGAERIFGYRADEMVGRPISVLIPEDQLNEEEEILDRLSCGKSIHHFETARLTKNGRKIAVSLTISPIRNAQGVVVGASKIARDITERVEAEERARRTLTELERLTSDYQALLGRLHSVREEERAYLAREIHDQLGQALTTLKLSSYLIERAARDGETATVVDKAQDSTARINDLIQLVRHLATELRPPLLDQLGLAAALKWQADFVRQQTGLDLQAVVPSEEPEVSAEEMITLFRIAQESLTNVIRHSQAKSASLRLQDDGPWLRLTISDSGKGLPAQELSRQSLGILGMRERARLIGASFSIDGRPGQGTTVTVVVPKTRPTEPKAVSSEAKSTVS